jgi:hypothetical protein
MIRASLLLLGLATLAGCPSTGALRTTVFGLKGERFEGRVVREANGGPISDELVPLTSARVTCEGCQNQPRLAADGTFDIDAAPEASIRLRVEASGYRPIEVAVPSMPTMSQAGPPMLTVVMQREATGTPGPD